MIKLLKKDKGITLIALIITVIVMLILAGIVINLTIGDNGIFSKSQQSVETYKIASAKEKIELTITFYQMNKENTTLLDELKKIEGISFIQAQDDNRLPYTVIVDGYEFVIKEDLSIIYQDKKSPSIPVQPEEGSIFASIHTKEVNQNQVLLTIRGESEGFPIEKMELYVAGEKVETYQYEDNKLEREETFTLSHMEFYQDLECYVVVTNSKKNTATSPSKIVKNIDTIESQVDLKNLATLVNSGNAFSGKTIYLIADLTTGSNWTPIGYYDGTDFFTGMPFSGTFEGNHHTITVSSLTKSDTYKSNGLFGMITNSNIKNLTVKGSLDATCEFIGAITGAALNSTISNCNNMGTISDTSNYNHGGIVGLINASTIQDCSNSGTVSGKSLVGGICGSAETNSKIINCTNSATIKCYGTSYIVWAKDLANSYGMVGGICGHLLNCKGDYGIVGCTNTGMVTGNESTIFPAGITAGGIVGWSKNSSITKSRNMSGKICYLMSSGTTNNGGGLGGIAGALTTDSTTEQCFNTGLISSRNGGIYCMDNSGGIVGYMSDSTIKNTYNTGIIYGNAAVGGIVGRAIDGRSNIYNSFNAQSDIAGTLNVGNAFGLTEKVTGNYIFWLAGTAPLGSDSNSTWSTDNTEYTLAQMKQSNSGFFTLLTKVDGNGVWEQSSTANNGLPYLKYTPYQ